MLRLWSVWLIAAGLLACGSGSVTGPECGNGNRDGDELCDGGDLSGQSCHSLGYSDGSLACDADCSGFDTAGCFMSTCGNGVIEPLEVCDGDNLGDDVCLDHGYVGGDLGCADDCGSFDFSQCASVASCGNDEAESPELCDGADLGGTDCRTFGFLTGELVCRPDCLGFDISGCLPGVPCVDALDCPVTARRCDPTLLVCVECLADADCSCHQMCEDRQCVAFAAALPEDGLHAHGNWSGTPSGADYQSTGSCGTDADCAVDQRCNPFTAGCVPAAVVEACLSASCPGGMLCDSRTDRCFPAGLCADARNCCGLAGIRCVAGIGTPGMCSAVECTPPETPSSVCPVAPRETAECSPGEFCSLTGQCVQCTCDADCDTVALPKCEVVSGTCVAEEFCRGASDCPADLACDRIAHGCVDACASSIECAWGRLCDPVDHVCYCQADAFEPNDAADAPGLPELPVPAEGGELSFAGTLCAGDQDWLTMTLSAGTRLEIVGLSTTGLAATMDAIASDQATVIASGSISDTSMEPLYFRASTSGVHYLRLSLVGGDGAYRLQVRRRAIGECDIGGINDSVAGATAVNSDPIAQGCVLSSGQVSGNHSIECVDALEICVDDVDYFSVTLAGAAELTVTIGNFPGQDLDLVLIGPFDPMESPVPERVAQVAASDEATETVRITTRGAALFIVEVSGYFVSGSTYDLHIDVATAPTDATCVEDVFDQATPTQPFDPAGSNDTIATASGIAVNAAPVQVDSNLCVGDVDWFVVGTDDAGSLGSLSAGNRLTVTVVPATGPGDDLVVMGGTDPVALATAVADADLGTQSVRLVTGGTMIYFAVAGKAAATLPRAYALLFEYLAPPACELDDLGDLSSTVGNDTPAAATILASPWPTTLGDPPHTFPANAGDELWSCAADDDWYRIDGVADLVTATILFDDSLAELGLAIYDDSVGTVVPTTGEPPTEGLLGLSAELGTGLQSVAAGSSGAPLYLLVYNPTGWPVEYSLSTEIRSVVTMVDTAGEAIPQVVSAQTCGVTGALARTLTVTASGYLADVDVGVDISTSSAGDLDLFIEFDNHGEPVCVELSTGNGSFGDNYAGTVFDDQAVLSIVGSVAPFTGHFRPETPLDVLGNLAIDGDWTLWVSSGFSAATLNEWSLNIERSPTLLLPDPPTGVVARGEDQAVTVSWNAVGSASGYTVYWDTSPGVTAGSGAAVAVGSSPWLHESLANGTSYYYVVSATNATGEGPVSAEVSATPSPRRVFVATPALPIPDDGQNPGTLCGATNGAASIIAVTEVDTITDVDVEVNLTHTYDGDLEILLAFDNHGSPLCIPLARRRGAGGDDFIATVFDDSASTSIVTGAAPFTGSFVPEGSLALLNGLAMDGDWTLYVYDTAGQDVGVLESWSLIIRF